MTKLEFQNSYGPAWAEITNNPAFFAAMQLVSAAKLARVAAVTDEEIQQHGAAILADFRGHLNMENALIDLAVSPVTDVFDLPPETYRDPTTETTNQPFTEDVQVGPFGGTYPKNMGNVFKHFPAKPKPVSPKRKPRKPK